MDLLDFFGRLHLLLLHLPIGFLLLAGALALLEHWKKTDRYRAALDLTIQLGALAAFGAAACGWLLARSGDYDTALLQRHQWSGFAAAGLSGATWLLRRSRWYFISLAATVGVVSVAGHFGGTLTHGEGYLTQPLSRKTGAGAPVFDLNASAYTAYIEPLLKQKCLSCHNPNKKKGELLLDTPENIGKGGKHGPVLVGGKPDSSELYRRVTLPIHDEGHMPPKGKLPLTPDETALLRQWIEQGADFKAPASTLKSLLAQQETAIFSPNLPKPAKAGALADLRTQRIAVMTLSAELPWVFVSAAAKRDLDADKLKLLEPIKMQLAHFDAAHSNLNDSLLNFVGKFPNLTRLNLSNTAVTDAGLKKMGEMPYLDYLNLSGTAVGDGAAAIILQYPKLRNLFVWSSKMTPAGLEKIKAGLPQLRINVGAPTDTSTEKLRLQPPKIEYVRSIFDDTVQVTLDFPFRNVGLHYSIGETEPGAASALYKGETFVFDRSVRLRAVAVKQGWADSKTAEASFLKRKWRPRETTLIAPPSPKYVTDPNALSDNRLGTSSADKTFIAYEGEHFGAVMDYGQAIEFGRIHVHYTENNDSWIFAPRGLRIWISDDAKKWTACLNTRYPAPQARQDENSGFISENLPNPVRTRFVKLQVESQMVNPAWHPGKGKKCWVFVDEILVE